MYHSWVITVLTPPNQTDTFALMLEVKLSFSILTEHPHLFIYTLDPCVIRLQTYAHLIPAHNLFAEITNVISPIPFP